jgi:hypothetical protein
MAYRSLNRAGRGTGAEQRGAKEDDMPVDGYLLLSGGTNADIQAIVNGAPAHGARRPCLLLGGTHFQAFIPIDADSPAQFQQKVTNIIGGRNVQIEALRVACPVHPPPGLHMCPIKRAAFSPGINFLAFALVNVLAPQAPGAVGAALTAIHGQGLTVSSIVKGSANAHILVEVQESSLAALNGRFTKLGQVNGIGFQRLGAKTPAAPGPGI